MFAYSMLYPLTDNIMDHSSLTKTEEVDIHHMVELIESKYDRVTYPKVYESILEIHNAQFESLRQQYDDMATDEMIRITFHKGAASVIADGYLVLGELTLKKKYAISNQ